MRPRFVMPLAALLVLSGCSDSALFCTRDKYISREDLVNHAIRNAITRNADRIARGEPRIGYSTVDEFRRDNPHCCMIDESREAWGLLPYDPNSVVIYVHYRARTDDAKPFFYETDFVTRCGELAGTYGSDVPEPPLRPDGTRGQH